MSDWLDYNGRRREMPREPKRDEYLEVQFRDGSTARGRRDEFIWTWVSPQDPFDDPRLDIVKFRILE